MKDLIQSGFRRSRTANRMGMVLFLIFVVILVLSVLSGVSMLAHV